MEVQYEYYDYDTSIFSDRFWRERNLKRSGISQTAKKEMGNRIFVYRCFCLCLCDNFNDGHLINGGTV